MSFHSLFLGNTRRLENILRQYSKSRFIEYYDYYLKSKPPIPNGRFKNNLCDESNAIRNILANYDSCGDNLCGDPRSIKDKIDTIKIKEDDDFLIIGDTIVDVSEIKK